MEPTVEKIAREIREKYSKRDLDGFSAIILLLELLVIEVSHTNKILETKT